MVDIQSIQFVTDENGKKQAVLVPIEAWQTLQQELQHLREYHNLRESLYQGFEEMNKIRKGQLPKTSLKSFLDDC